MAQATATTGTTVVGAQGPDNHEHGAVPGVAPPGRDPSRRRARSMRGRMARILALPLVAVLVLLVLVAAGPVGDFRESRRTTRSVDVALAVQSLVDALQNERGVAALVLGGNDSFTNELGRVRTTVDTRRSQVAALVAGDGTVEGRVRSALQSLDGLGPVRAATDSGAAARQATFTFYTQRIATLSGVDVGLSDVSDRELTREVAKLRALSDTAEGVAQERALLSGVFSAGGFRTGEFVEFAAMRAAKDAAWSRFLALSDADERAAADYVTDTGAARVVAYFEKVAIGAADGRHVVVNPQTWWSAHTTLLDGIRRLEEHEGGDIRLRAFELQQQATTRLGGLLALVLFCAGGSIYLAVLASRSVSRPLAVLAAEAETVATDRLPAAMRRLETFDATSGGSEPAPPRPTPVAPPPRASEEIRSVVAALNHLQDAAYRLAVDQAVQRRATLEALTNLGRRNQNLVRKQLRFISNLEKEEMDPTGLANLFELDHLATRMRRNAASLLVLTGSQTPGQWTSPTPVADVVRAAISEVEDYRRVALRRVDEVLVSGAVIGSLAHLLSELIENGLRFSPPDSEVEVVGRQLGEDYLVAVVDQGIGMTHAELAEANARLRGEGDFMVTPSRFLGHYVVGRLAEQAGVRVELLPSPVTGVTARIHLPKALLVSSGQITAGQVVSVAGEVPVLPRPEPSAASSPGVAPVVASAGWGVERPGERVIDLRGDAADEPVPVSSSIWTGEIPVRPPDSIFNNPAPPAPATPLPPVSTAVSPPAPTPASLASTPPDGTPRTAGPSADLPTDLSADLSTDLSADLDSRTRNGLRVRVPGSTRPAARNGAGARPAGRASSEGAWPPPTGAPVLAAPVEETAQGRIGSRLSALRSGMARGLEDGAADGAPDGVVPKHQRVTGSHREERS